MLVQKKISAKKLGASLAIIFVMVCGTGFMLYQNKKLTTGKSTGANSPLVFINSVPNPGTAVTPAGPGDMLITGEAKNQAATGTSQAIIVNKPSQSGGLDVSIFSSDKFKNLRANTFVVKGAPELGKRDPFSPN